MRCFYGEQPRSRCDPFCGKRERRYAGHVCEEIIVTQFTRRLQNGRSVHIFLQ